MTTATAKVPRLVGGVPEVRISNRSAPPIRGETSFATIGNLTRISVSLPHEDRAGSVDFAIRLRRRFRRPALLVRACGR
jgi:hypothetical protein